MIIKNDKSLRQYIKNIIDTNNINMNVADMLMSTFMYTDMINLDEVKQYIKEGHNENEAVLNVLFDALGLDKDDEENQNVMDQYVLNNLKKLNPSAKKVGVLYCSSEANSKVQAQKASEEATKLGLQARDYTISSSSELQQMVEYMCLEVDVIFVPTDNLVVSCMPLVSKVATANKIPIICSESASVKNGALATYGIDYYDLGKNTARQSVRILKGEAKPENMAIEYINEPKLVINYEVANQLGIVIPDELKGELQ